MLRCLATALIATTHLACVQVDGGAGAGGGAGGEGGASTSSQFPVDCSPFEDDLDGAQPVTIRVTNATSSELFLMTGDECGPDLELEVSGPDGSIRWWHSQVCTDLCRDKTCGCFLGCGAWPPAAIAAGTSFSYEWAGTFFRPVARPPACAPAEACEEDTCLVEDAPGPGPYDVTIEAHTALTCDAEGNDCQVSGDARSATTTWSGGAEIDLIFR